MKHWIKIERDDNRVHLQVYGEDRTRRGVISSLSLALLGVMHEDDLERFKEMEEHEILRELYNIYKTLAEESELELEVDGV